MLPFHIMTYAVPPHICVAVCQGRPIFLDLRAGRYFAIPNALSRAFLEVIEGGGGATRETPELDSMVKLGVLNITSQAASSPLPIVARPSDSLQSQLQKRPSLLAHVAATAAYINARAELKLRPFAAIIRRLQIRKAAAVARGATPATETLAAHSRLGRLVSVADQCLPRSIALMDHLARAGVHPQFVIGVRMPFAAHCWVQTDEYLISDHCLTVSDYTPILVI